MKKTLHNPVVVKLFIVFILLFHVSLLKAQVFIAASDISARYLNGSCNEGHSIAVKFKYMYVDNPRGRITNIKFYYKDVNGGSVQFATLVISPLSITGSNVWSDAFWGGGYTWFNVTNVASNRGTIHSLTRNNSNADRYAEVVWSGIPAAAIVNGMVTIVTDGEYSSGSSTTWAGTAIAPVLLPILSVPTNLLGSNGTFCDKVQVDWAAPNSFPCSYNYEIYRNNVKIGTVNQNQTSFNDAAAAQGTHQYSVKAVHTSTVGALISSQNSFVVYGAKKTAPTMPYAISASNSRCDGIVQLNWSYNYSSLFPDNFEVQRSTNPISGFTTISNAIDPGNSSFMDNVPSRSTTYYYKVGAKGECGTTLSSSSYPGESATIPTKPTNVSAVVNNNAITITWTDNSTNENGFIVERSILGGSGGSTKFDVDANVTSYIDRDVTTCTRYIYNVRAKNNCQPLGVAADVTSSAIIYPVLSTSFNGTTNKLKCSKGYFTNMVQLEWTTSNIDILTQYRIYRKIYGASSDSTLIATVAQGVTSYSDNAAASSTLYKYTVVGILNCSGESRFSNVTEDIGFKNAFGTVSGQLTYTGGFALNNAKVMVTPAATSFLGASIKVNTGGSLTVPASSKLSFTSGITLETWFNSENADGNKDLIKVTSGNKYASIGLQGNKVVITAFNGSATRTVNSGSTTFLAHNYNQLSGTFSQDSLVVYLNGIRQGAISLAGFSYLPLTNSAITIASSFTGHVDEIRVFDYAKTASVIKRDYDRKVNPDENGLVAYYSFDENMAGYNGFFDYSRKGAVYNENHGTMTNASFDATKIPSSSQLTFASYSDETGNYIVTNIGYQGIGQVFAITPAFETHSFSPINRTIYIGDGSAVHSSQDFIDNSSFTVSGTVFYAGTTCPAEGINFKIDEQLVVSNGLPIATDENGTFTIQVPIGNHVITASKEGHIFSAGRFPATGTYNFQSVVAGVQFVDSTFIKVVGRAVGGPIEAAKKPGLGLSVNNIGKAHLFFKSQMGNGCKTLNVITNDSTGEYIAYLPPLVYTIDTVRVPTNPVLNFGVQAVLDLTNATNKLYSADTIYLPGSNTISRIDSITYNVRRDFIYYTTPSVMLVRTKNKTQTDTSFIGEPRVDIDSVNSIDLTTTNPFTYPVFIGFKQYTAGVHAYDVYTNFDKVPAKQFETPLNGQLLVNNSLAENSTAAQTVEIVDGQGLYTFRAGVPDLTVNALDPSLSFTKTMQVTFFTTGNTGDRRIDWLPNPGNTPFRGYIFGGRTRSTEYLTSGPQKVDFILRDPPGSASSATWSKNTAKTTSHTYNHTNNVGGQFDGTINVGGKWETWVGLGAGVNMESSAIGNAGESVGKTTASGDGNSLVVSMSSSMDISTGGGSDQVGIKADILFGHSENYVFGISDNFKIVPAADCDLPGAICGETVYNGYRLGVRQGLSLNPKEITTAFAYTVGEVEDIVIPNLVQARNLILSQSKLANGQPKYIINYTDTEDEDYEQKFGANNDDPIWGTRRNKNNPLVQDAVDSTGPSYTYMQSPKLYMDSVRYYNNQIRLWKEALAQNEQERYEAFELGMGGATASNISIGRALLTKSYTTSRSTTTSTSTEVFFNSTTSFGFALDVVGSGFDFQGSVTVEDTKSDVDETGEENSTTISYTLQDGDEGDLISVDVIESKAGNGHMFKLRAGQTSCPHEGPVWSNYYKPNDTIHASTYYKVGEAVKLSEGTAKRHVPKIQIPQPVKYNVPASDAATFILQLGNESESDDDQTYSLKVIDVTNPHGAILTIDGLDPNRDFSVPYATSITKTLTIRRGTEHYDYDSILLVFKSPCDDDLADSVYVSVHYIPTCTQPIVYSPADKWTLNNSFQDTMSVIINGYDYNFGGFKELTFQYKPSSSSQWNILQTFKKVPTEVLDREIPALQSYIEYKWNMKQLVDGPYDIRAVATCTAPGHLDAVKESPVNSGLADRVNPSPFGNPSPADGILSPNDEIMIQFNEPVDNASLTYSNFDIRGVLNGSATQNTASLYFDGDNDYVEVPTGLILSRKSFSIEFWVKRQRLGEEVVFSQGIDNSQFIATGFDAADRFYFRIGNEKVRTNAAFTDTVSFHHFTVSYNFEADQCELFIDGVVSNTGNTSIYNKYEGSGKTIIGKLSKDNSEAFRGNLRDIRLWSKTRTSADILGSINNTLRGTEGGIMANWRFDEATGVEVKDYIRSRNATIHNATWEINPKGSSYKFVNEPLTVAAGDIAFTEQNDFTIEFWFKGNNTNNYVSLFSNGKGDSTDVNPLLKWNIEKDPNGKIFIRHRGINFEAVSDNYFDGNWHHFALVMQRATSLTIFVDGNQQKNVYPEEFKQFGGDRIVIGGRLYQPIVGNAVVDNPFTGYVDEVRIWNTARTQAQIDRDRVNRLQGTEVGLVSYIPFETYVLNMGVPVLTPNLTDILTPSRSLTGHVNNGSGLNSETPTIKLPRPVQSINFTYSVNQDKIILTPTTLPELIENITLDITVKNVKDLNGNIMQSPKTWIAYVDKNQVKWQDQEFNFDKKVGQPLSFTTNIVNSGGALKTFNLQNLPSWLSANPSTATISPNSFKTITFTIDPNVNIGTYENEVQLLTDFGFPDGLMLRLKVYAETPSNWVVNESAYQNSMSITAQIRVNNVISTNADDKLAVFVGNECRGVANLQYFPQIDRYYAFLNVFSNETQGEQLEFRIWNASAGKIHADVTPHLQFVTNAQVGSISAPQVFNATDKLNKLIPITTGWNWLSFNLAMTDSADINKLLSGVKLGNGAIFRSQTTFADYSALNGWVGSLANPSGGIKPEKSYRLRSAHVDTLVTIGVEVDPSQRIIQIEEGWNWLGFVSQRNLSVTEALSSLNASDGDMIKSQSQFALYDQNIGWVGSLTALIPNKGYMYRSAANTNFAYPRSAMFGKKETGNNEYQSNHFKYEVAKYENNMSAVIDAGVCNSALATGRFSLGAYVGNELRGATKVSILANGKNIYFLNISSNEEKEKVTFKLLDEQDGKTYDLQGSLLFETNKLVGTLIQPQTLINTGNFNCDNYKNTLTATGRNIFVYPNPFNSNVVINIQGFNSANMQVKVFDVAGKLIDAFDHESGVDNNSVNIDWNPENRGVTLNAGVYFVEVSANGNTVRTKVIKY